MNVFLLGSDGVGWSIDRDREYTARALAASGHRLVRNPFRADVTYCVWWNLLDSPRWRLLARRPLVAVVTNDLAHQADTFARLRRRVDVWVVANTQQRRFLVDNGVPPAAICHTPFYVDEDVFRPLRVPRAELAARIGLDPARLDGRFLVGSFQRDSLGEDLSQPKWQKDPGLLADVVERTGGEATLVLAGPRRHYLLEQCRRRSLPYLFVGEEPPAGSLADDIAVNTLPIDRIALLWNMLDLYIVSSRSEGGPKAVIEAGLTGTAVISTPVGLAADLLPEELLFGDAAEGAALVRRHIAGNLRATADGVARRVRDECKFERFRARVDDAVRLAASGSAAR